MSRHSRSAAASRFVHLLTALHAIGAGACVVMAVGSGLSSEFRDALVVSGGSAIMVETFGRWTWLFLTFVGTVLAVLAWGSWRLRGWAWPMTLVVYGVGVGGSLWQVWMGVGAGWVSATVNAAVVGVASTRGVRRAYGKGHGPPGDRAGGRAC